MRRWFQALAIGVGLATAVASGANAQNPTSLDRILKEKKLRVTAEVTAPPFGMIDANGQPDGSEVATARQLAKDLGVDVDFIQVTGPQRIPTLLSGRADIAISSLSMTIDRAKVVMFASPHGALSIVIAAPASVDIKDAKGMSGKRIGITRATLEEATYLTGVAAAGFEAGVLGEALAAATRATLLFEHLGRAADAARALLARAAIFAAAGAVSLAADAADLAIARARLEGDIRCRAFAHLARADVAARTDAEGLDHARRAAALLENATVEDQLRAAARRHSRGDEISVADWDRRAEDPSLGAPAQLK